MESFKVGMGDELITEAASLFLPLGLLSRIAIRTSVGAAHYRINGGIAPLDACDVHEASVPLADILSATFPAFEDAGPVDLDGVPASQGLHVNHILQCLAAARAERLYFREGRRELAVFGEGYFCGHGFTVFSNILSIL
jgi:hypothetical protein